MTAPHSEPQPKTDQPPPDGRSLLVRHLGGDVGAFRELMTMFASPIYSYISRCGVAPAERDDLFQEIFCRIHRGAPRFDHTRPIKPWIFTIAANTVRTHFSRHVPKNIVQLHKEHEKVDRDTPLKQLEGREAVRQIEAMVAELPSPQREVVLLCCIEQLSQKDVSTTLGLPINTVKTHLYRARLHLAKRLAANQLKADREVTR